MSEPTGHDATAGELERLRRENEALNGQVRLLVLTEQRLYRSQNELDAQLELVRALASFALESSASEEPEETIVRALELVGQCFSLDWAGYVHVGPGPNEATVLRSLDEAGATARSFPLAMADTAWLGTRANAELQRWSAASPPAGWRVIAAALPALVPDGGSSTPAEIACVPLRGSGAFPPGMLMLVSLRPRPFYLQSGPVAERHLPYLQLIAHHVDHALANSHLTRSLRDRSAELVNSLERLERAQQELVQVQKMEAIGRLAGGVAHDFNNLLTVILGYASALTTSLPEGSPGHQNVTKVVEAAQRAANLTRQLLAMGRRQVQRREVFSLAEQCERTVELLRRLVGEHIRIELDLDRALPAVHADRTQVEQVLLNLIVNARDAMPEGGQLRIAARAATDDDARRCDEPISPERFAVLVVEDSGVGMDAATRERIFEPFFSTKPTSRGSGLGLAVVYGIVKQSEGHILVDSEPGHGAAFRVLLPLGEVRANEAPVARTVARPGADAPGATVLVVEDELSIREVIRAALRRSGYRVIEATDGEDALARCGESAPDLVLTDVLMPRMGGPALAAALRRRFPKLRVAYMSGYAADFKDGVSGGDHGDDFLAKPFTPDDLRAFVARQIDRPAHDGA